MADQAQSTVPERQGLVLAALILVAAVANLNLAVANVALPDIGKAFDAGQTELNLVAVGHSLGLAASVVFLAGDSDAYVAGIVAILLGAAVVRLLFPGRDEERELIAGFGREDAGAGVPPVATAGASR